MAPPPNRPLPPSLLLALGLATASSTLTACACLKVGACLNYSTPHTGETGGDADTDTDTDTDTGGPLAFQVTVNWFDDGLVPADTDGDGLPDVGCGDTLQVVVNDPMGNTNWSFGMAETGSPVGWYGEDCFMGYGGFNYCHDFTGDTLNLAEVTDCSVLSVVEGQTTLFDAAKDPYLTYILGNDQNECWVWGHDVSYYAALPCTEL